MIIGYGIIAVPTAIVTAEMTRPTEGEGSDYPLCPSCGWENHDTDARYCKVCGEKLPQQGKE